MLMALPPESRAKVINTARNVVARMAKRNDRMLVENSPSKDTKKEKSQTPRYVEPRTPDMQKKIDEIRKNVGQELVDNLNRQTRKT